jgi:ferredoxin
MATTVSTILPKASAAPEAAAPRALIPCLPQVAASHMPLRSAPHLIRFHFGTEVAAAEERRTVARPLNAVMLGQEASVANGTAQGVAESFASVVQRYAALLARVHGAAYAARVGEARALCKGLRALLAADDAHAPRARSAEALAGALGGLGAGLLDPRRLARSLQADKGPLRLSVARRSRVEDALATLAAACDSIQSAAVHVVSRTPTALPASPEVEVAVHAEPHACAIASYDALLAARMAWARAERVARLELSHDYDAAFHDAVLAGLSLSELGPEEQLSVPAFLVLEDATRLQTSAFDVLFGTRPLQVMVRCGRREKDASTPFVPVATWASLAERSGLYVVSSSTSRREHLDGALESMARATVPALSLIAAGEEEDLSCAALDLAVCGRFHPLFVSDPQRRDRTERASLAHNPEPAQAWAHLDVHCVLPSGLPAELASALTPVDFLESTELDEQHILPLAESEWAADQVPLAELAVPADGSKLSGGLPYIWLLDGRNQLVRALVSRAVLLATCDVGAAYSKLQEACGLGDPWVLGAVDVERKRASIALAEAVEAERKKHAGELASARESAGADALRRLVDVLLDPDFIAAPGASATPPTAPEAAPPDVPVTKVQERPPLPGPVTTAAASDIGADPYVESERCTSCNECTQKHPSLFAYDQNKQAAYVGPEKPAFAELVSAAEKCPVRCIHLGNTLSDPAISPELAARAAPFV